MTTLDHRPGTALLVIDVQRDVVDQAHDRDAIVGRIADLVDRARTQDVPVLWVQHADDGMPRDSDGWQYVDELVLADDEPVIHKAWGDSFEDTDLEDRLATRHVGHLVIAGAATDACIRSTLHGALTRGYDVTLVGDAHTTEDMRQWGVPVSPEQAIGYTNAYWGHTSAPGRTTAVVDTADVAFAAPA